VKHSRKVSISCKLTASALGVATVTEFAIPLRAQTWQPTPTPQITAGAIACSQDGQSLYTTAGDGEKYLFVSTNVGATWTNTLQHFVGPVACSGDGSKVAIADYNMLISTNHGLSFVTNTGTSSSSVQWSETGNMLVGISDGGICITTDLGATWARPPRFGRRPYYRSGRSVIRGRDPPYIDKLRRFMGRRARYQSLLGSCGLHGGWLKNICRGC